MRTTHMLTRSTAALALTGLAAACSSVLPFTKIDGSDPAKLSMMNGSWTVMQLGDTKTEGMNPPATVVFDTANRAVSGFDGCNDFKGSYTFDQGRLKANVAGTRRACTSDLARNVSARMADLFAQGAEVVDTSMMGAHVLMLRNAGGDLRMGSTSALQKK